MKRINAEKQHSLCVQPVFLMGTYDDGGNPNFTPITWVSVTWDTDHYMLVISIFGTKKTKENIAKNGMLSVNLVSTDMLALLDYFGSCSGRDGIKDAVPYEYESGNALPVPTLNASRWVYECKVAKTVQTGDSHTYFCDIKNIQYMEEMGGRDGIDLTLFDPVIYSGDYHSIGRHLGTIGDFYQKR